MARKSSITLGDLCRQAPIRDNCRTLSVTQLMQELKTYDGRTAYYIGTDYKGTRLFGINNASYMLVVPEKVYNATGILQEGEEIPLKTILEAFKQQNSTYL